MKNNELSKIEQRQEIWLADIHKALVSGRFYGKLELHYENGSITFSRKEETLKPPNNRN